jgi:hypothetical protein
VSSIKPISRSSIKEYFLSGDSANFNVDSAIYVFNLFESRNDDEVCSLVLKSIIRRRFFDSPEVKRIINSYLSFCKWEDWPMTVSAAQKIYFIKDGRYVEAVKVRMEIEFITLVDSKEYSENRFSLLPLYLESLYDRISTVSALPRLSYIGRGDRLKDEHIDSFKALFG